MENVFFHYAAAERLYTAMVNPVCEKHDLTYMEFTVLMFLANNPQFDTASDIIKYRRLTKSHVSLSIHGLTNKGLISGAYHGTNRKTIHLTVLTAADAIVSDGRAAQQHFGDILFSDFSDAEYLTLSSFFSRIDNNINNYTDFTQGKQEHQNGRK